MCCVSYTVVVDHVAIDWWDVKPCSIQSIETRLQGRVAEQNQYEYEH